MPTPPRLGTVFVAETPWSAATGQDPASPSPGPPARLASPPGDLQAAAPVAITLYRGDRAVFRCDATSCTGR